MTRGWKKSINHCLNNMNEKDMQKPGITVYVIEGNKANGTQINMI